MTAFEVAEGDARLELVQGHTPDVSPVVDRLGQCLTEVGIPGPCLELGDEDLTRTRNPDEVHSAERLLEHVWDEHADPFTNTVRVTLSNLRRKLADANGGSQPIETLTGSGYRLRSDA